ncbi:MAG TPA: 2-C-methyl-D-erythritol 4-phosphate cytidylyltransferase, partial [Lysobacter sp.]
MTREVWVVMPAAGRGTRFGGEVPKQYLDVAGQPVIAHALDAALEHPDVRGAVVALSPGDPHWPGWTSRYGKPVTACIGGAERAESVLAALRALPPAAEDALVLVHDAARPNLDPADVARLVDAARASEHGAILAAPVRDTLKRVQDGAPVPAIACTEPRERLWRALTPQAFRCGALHRALEHALAGGRTVTDEAMA